MQSIAVVCCLATLCTTASAQETGPRSARAILRDFHGVAMPSMSGGNSPEAVAAFEKAIDDGCRRKAELALELWRAHPEHREVPSVMATRWAGMTNALEESAAVFAETEAFLGAEVPETLRIEAAVARSRAALGLDELTAAQKLQAIRAAIAAAPKDERCGVNLMDFVEESLADPEAMRRLAELARKRWPDSAWVTAPARGLLKQLDKVGKPYPLAFTDVLSGETIDVQKSGSEFVLVLVWSGVPKYSGKDELEAVRAIAKKHDVEKLAVVAVCNGRHEDGVEGLRAELAAHGIDWPHLYDEKLYENPWQGPYAVPRVPFYYLLDDRGVVRAVGYRAELMAAQMARLRRAR